MKKAHFTPAEVMEITGKPRDTLYRHLRNGNLPAARPPGTRQYIVTRSDLATYLGSDERAIQLIEAWEARQG
jgi:excisionase family DNA binding protein